MIYHSFSRSILCSLFLFVSISLFGQISFPTSSSYRYLKGSEASSLPTDWNQNGFDDSSWSTGTAPFWYGDGAGGTTITDMRYNYTTFFLRSSFTATNASTIQELLFSINFDDGFIVYINGDEVLNVNAPTPFNYADSALDQHESGVFEDYTVSGYDVDLVEGINTIAVACFNVNLSSSDFHFDMSISASSTTPILNDTVGISFSHPSGYYDNPFTLILNSPDPAATIIYTLDGSNPQVSSTAITAGGSATISVNPASTNNRAATPGFIVRASLSKPGFKPSFPNGQTYIFKDALLQQDYPGGSWPAGDVVGVTYPSQAQMIDYEMDPDIINDSRYSSKMDQAFTDIPTLSIMTDNADLFDPNIGIYVNAAGHGMAWEKNCTFELFDPKGNEDGFNVNAGLRIRGGWSRHPDFPKHSFRLFFRSEYGSAKLYYPLFGDEGVDTYDKIDLRTSQNYAWSKGSAENTMVREVFSRDMQRDMGRPYTRSKYYHLYLNGMYWGLYQTQERSEARFASDYFGDSSDDYDVVKVSTENWNYNVEATDGNLDSWQDIYQRTENGYADNADYFALEGKNASGIEQPGGEKIIDIDNLIDYMLTIFYAGNFDAPTSSFGGNDGPNNFYAIDDRDDLDKGFVFFNHDAEHSLFYYAHSPGEGISENRVDIGTREGNYRMEDPGLYGFHPQWLHFRLSENPEYRLRFADRAVLYLSQGGELTPEKCIDRFMSRANQIDKAIIAESARWGDMFRGDPLNKEDHWDYEIEHTVSQFFPARTNIVINQLKAEGLYPDVAEPEIYRNEQLLTETEYNINPGWIISMENPNSYGEIFYTLNGKDPRTVGGGLRNGAIKGDKQVLMTLTSSTVITARVFRNGEWSGLKQMKFYSNSDDLSKLKITEIHYHPLDVIEGADTTSGKDFEFLEFKNTGNGALNLSGLTIDSAVSFTVPEGTILGPGQFYVVISKPSGFYAKFGKIGSGNFKGNLANSGEQLLVKDSQGNVLMNFVYDDSIPWPEMPDGEGPSLVATQLNPTGDPGNPSYWRASYHVEGSPYADDLMWSGLEEEYAAENEKPAIILFPNPTAGELQINWHNNQPISEAMVSLYHVDGRLIHKELYNSLSTIQMQDYVETKGIYLVQIQLNGWVYNQKVVFTP